MQQPPHCAIRVRFFSLFLSSHFHRQNKIQPSTVRFLGIPKSRPARSNRSQYSERFSVLVDIRDIEEHSFKVPKNTIFSVRVINQPETKTPQKEAHTCIAYWELLSLHFFSGWEYTLRAAHDPTQSKRSRIMKFYLSLYMIRPSHRRSHGKARGRNVRSKSKCSVCPAIHTKSRSWLRSSSTREPSDPPLRVLSFFALSIGTEKQLHQCPFHRHPIAHAVTRHIPCHFESAKCPSLQRFANAHRRGGRCAFSQPADCPSAL